MSGVMTCASRSWSGSDSLASRTEETVSPPAARFSKVAREGGPPQATLSVITARSRNAHSMRRAELKLIFIIVLTVRRFIRQDVSVAREFETDRQNHDDEPIDDLIGQLQAEVLCS